MPFKRFRSEAIALLIQTSFALFLSHSLSEKAGVELDGGSYLIHKVYDDEETLSLVAAACETLGMYMYEHLATIYIPAVKYRLIQDESRSAICDINLTPSYFPVAKNR